MKTGFFIICIAFFLSGCFYFTDPLYLANRALNKGHCSKSWQYFQDLRETRAVYNKKQWINMLRLARRAGSLCQQTSPFIAQLFYQYLIQQPVSIQELVFFNKQLMKLFEKANNYQQVIPIYIFLKQNSVDINESYRYNLAMAQAYFELKQWSESMHIIDESLKKVIKHNIYFSFLFLKARIFLIKRQYSLAEQIFHQIRLKNKMFFNKHKMFLYLSFIYEYRKEFQQAILELENFSYTSEFLSMEIQRLKERQSNQPGQFRKKIK